MNEPGEIVDGGLFERHRQSGQSACPVEPDFETERVVERTLELFGRLGKTEVKSPLILDSGFYA